MTVVFSPGAEVVVSFLDGNPDRPYISGGVRNADTANSYVNGVDKMSYIDGKEYVAKLNSFVQTIGNNKIAQEGAMTNASLAAENSISNFRSAVYSKVTSRFAATAGTFRSTMTSSTDMTDVESIVDLVVSIVEMLCGTKSFVDAACDELPSGLKTTYGYAKDYTTKIAGLTKYLGVFANFKTIKKQNTRFLMSVEPKANVISQVQPIADKKDYILLVVTYALDAVKTVMEWFEKRNTVVDAMNEYKNLSRQQHLGRNAVALYLGQPRTRRGGRIDGYHLFRQMPQSVPGSGDPPQRQRCDDNSL